MVVVGGVEDIIFLGVPNMVKYAFLLLFCRFNLLGNCHLNGNLFKIKRLILDYVVDLWNAQRFATRHCMVISVSICNIMCRSNNKIINK